MNGRVLVRQDRKESKAGIIIDAEYRDRQPYGTVMAAAEGSALHEGDRICFRELSGDEMEMDGEKLVILKETDVIARLYD